MCHPEVRTRGSEMEPPKHGGEHRGEPRGKEEEVGPAGKRTREGFQKKKFVQAIKVEEFREDRRREGRGKRNDGDSTEDGSRVPYKAEGTVHWV